MTLDSISEGETVRVFVNEAERYIGHLRLLINEGQHFEFGKVRKDFEDLLRLMENRENFPNSEIIRLRKEYTSLADPRVLQHLEECYGF